MAANSRTLKILITGASSGIGAAAAARLAEKGHEVALVARRKEELEKVARKVESKGGKAHVIPADLADASSAEKIVAEAVQKMGGLDVLVNNAGFAHGRPVGKQKPERINQMVDVNIRAPFLLAHYAIPHLEKSKKGRIINVASFVGHVPLPGLAVYSASKFALVGFTEALSAELAGKKIGVTAICPGLVDTPMAKDFPVAGPALRPEAVAKAIEEAIRNPTTHVFVPRTLEMAAAARRLAPRTFARGLRTYGRLRAR
ncbi:MAG: SDR family oxidoreductase [Bdellovibrionota bacterium]